MAKGKGTSKTSKEIGRDSKSGKFAKETAKHPKTTKIEKFKKGGTDSTGPREK